MAKVMSDIKVIDLENSRFTHKDVVDLIHSSFQQWRERGVESSLLKLTPEVFIENTMHSSVFVAINGNGELVGTTTCDWLIDKHNVQYAYNKYSAVSPLMKKSGIGSLLFDYEKECARSRKCSYILSDTSVLAPWSLKWHIKNGFNRVGLISFNSNKYYSYLFRCQLKSPSIWDFGLYRNIRFFLSFCKTKIWQRPNGEHTKLARLIIRLLALIIRK